MPSYLPWLNLRRPAELSNCFCSAPRKELYNISCCLLVGGCAVVCIFRGAVFGKRGVNKAMFGSNSA